MRLARKLDPHGRDVLAGALVSLLTRLLGAAAQFGFNVMLGRLLGADGMGLYVLALSVSMIASVLGRAGMDFSIVRFVAIHRSKGQWGRLKLGWRRMVKYVTVLSALVSLLLWISAPLITQQMFAEPALTTPLRWMALGIVPLSLLNILAESLRAAHRVGQASLVQALLLPVFCVGFFLLLYYTGEGVRGAVLAYVLATTLVCVIAYGLWRRAMPELTGISAQHGPSAREILAVAIPMAWVSISAMLMGLADTIILGMYRPASEVGIYSAAMRVSILISFVLVAVNSMLAPKFAALHERGEQVAMERLGQFATKLMVMMALPLGLIFLIVPENVLLLFGVDFQAGAGALIILTVSQLVNVSVGSVGLLLLMSGNERRMQWINLGSLTINVSLAVLLVPAYGITGAAWSSAAGLVFLNIVALVVAIRCVGVSTIPGISIAAKA